MPTRAPVHRVGRSAAPVHVMPGDDRQARRSLPTNSARWRRIRAQQLATEPLCRCCAHHGCRSCAPDGIRAASHVDHIDGDDSNSAPANLQSLCARCHSVKTATADGGFGNRGGSKV